MELQHCANLAIFREANVGGIVFYWNNSSLNPYWNSNLEHNFKFIHVPGISGKQGMIQCDTKIHLINIIRSWWPIIII